MPRRARRSVADTAVYRVARLAISGSFRYLASKTCLISNRFFRHPCFQSIVSCSRAVDLKKRGTPCFGTRYLTEQLLSRAMNSLKDYLAREKFCRQHAALDKTTAGSWFEEAEIWAKLAQVEKRLSVLRSNKSMPTKRRNSAQHTSRNSAPLT